MEGMSENVLLRTPDSLVRQRVEEACRHLEVRLAAAETIEQAFERIDALHPAVFLLDVERPDPEDLQTLGQVRLRWPRLCTILIADHASSELAIEAMKRGIIDYLIKPLEHDALVEHIRGALQISRDMTVPTVYSEQNSEAPVARIIGQSPAMHEVFKRVGLIAPRDVNVLITGESGTGKELVAKALYHHSPRKDRPFLAVNCAAIPETLLESELFGHEKGAFTGADVRRIGKFEQCDEGTLFLDEIGDLPLATQAKLLRVLQDGSFQRLGGMRTIHCDVRIIAATNQALDKLIGSREFREDLYYRLKVAEIHVPPLREREVDVILLAHYFVRKYNTQMHSTIRTFSPEVLPVLLRHTWPGNVRELENVIKTSLVVARGTVFLTEFLPEHIRRSVQDAASQERPTGSAPDARSGSLAQAARQLASRSSLHGRLYRHAVEAAERDIIRACLEHTRGRLAPAAAMLGITRTTLRAKMAKLKIQVSTAVDVT